jgi:tetratricopeptide (TPR) repeat protein
MSFVRRAEQNIADGVNDTSIQMNYIDAGLRLSRATAADPERYRDAFLPLASALWFEQKLERARAAASEATRRFPKSPDTWTMLGRVAFSQFVAVRGEGEAWSEEASAHLATALDSFEAAARCFGEPAARADQSALAAVLVEIGNVHVWKRDRVQAAEAYGTAIGWSPDTVDLGQVWSALAPPVAADGAPSALPEEFAKAVETGHALFLARTGGADPRDAGLLWWLGFELFQRKKYAESEQAFAASLAKRPDFVNAWYYVALARASEQDQEGALAAMKQGWSADIPTIVLAVQNGGENSTKKLLALADYFSDASARPERKLDAALLWEVLAAAAVTHAPYWSNLGLFLRDEGDRIEAAAKEPDRRLLMDLYERSYAAYLRALDLEPDNPILLNDTAVVLDYNLDRDLERALELYERAKVRAAEELAKPDAADREGLETALRDATNNAERVRRKILERKKPADE